MSCELYIVEGSRTPFCKFNTLLSDEPLVNLGTSPVKYILSKAKLDPSYVDEVVFGCCNQPTTTLGNVARTIGLQSGIPDHVPAVSVHRNCASGFEAITYAHDKAAAGRGDVFIVGGVESMSQAPFLFSRDAVKKFTDLARCKSSLSKIKLLTKFRPKDFSPQVSLKLGMHDNTCDLNMGQTAELIAREFNVSRKEQDEFAELSHYRAIANHDRFDDEISPFYLTESNCIRSYTDTVITQDNGPRNDAGANRLARLRTSFDRQGTVTAGNSSQVTDGGAALILMTSNGLKKTGCEPIGKIVDYAYSGCDPSRMGLGPVSAMTKLCSRLNVNVNDADLIEINEAFAAQVLAVLRHSRDVFQEIPTDILNVKGGAIALGHPLAATGTRLVLTLIKELKHKQLKRGLASLCVGGGQGGAIWIENI